MRVGQCRDIHLIEMSPTDRPNQAYACFGLGTIIWPDVNAACMTADLYQDMPCGHEQIVRW